MTDPTDAELRALCEAATPGPWQARFMWRVFDAARKDNGTVWGTKQPQDWSDCEFIAAARTALPRLLDERDGLRAALAEAQKLAFISGALWSEAEKDVVNLTEPLKYGDMLCFTRGTFDRMVVERDALLADMRTVAEALRPFAGQIAPGIEGERRIVGEFHARNFRTAADALAIAERHINKDGGNDRHGRC